jgi:hypothetical protein
VKVLAKPIRMISAFDERGAPTPLRFKVEEEGVWNLVKVDKIVSSEAIKPAGMDAIVFRCQSEIQGLMKQYELIYRVKPHVWELYKM